MLHITEEEKLIYINLILLIVLINYLLSKIKLKMLPYSLLVLFSSIPLAIVTGYRDYNIGTDRGVYGDFVFKSASLFLDSATNYILYIKNIAEIEKGYILLNYFTARIYNDLNFYYFIVFIIEIILVIWSLNLTIPRNLHWLGLSIYFFVIFPASLNYIRQVIAMTIILLGTSYILKNKKKGIILYFLALFFHKTSVIAFLIPIFLYFSSKIKNYKTYYICNISLTVILFLIFGPFFKEFVILFGTEKYFAYLYENQDGGVLNVLIARIPFMILFLNPFKNKKMFTISRYSFFYSSLFITELIGTLQRGSIPLLGRLSLYFYIIFVLAIPLRISEMKNENAKKIISIGLFIFLIFIFYWQIIRNGGYQIYPYSSTWLDNIFN